MGRLPHIGFLFRQEVDEDQKRELILLITPHVIMTPAEGELKTRWRVKELSDHPYAHPNTRAHEELRHGPPGEFLFPTPANGGVPYETLPPRATDDEN